MRRLNGHARLVRSRNRLFENQAGKCHWCDCACIRPEDLPADHRERGQYPDNMATVDHLDDRFSPMRGQLMGQRRVMACRRCNQQRSKESIEENLEEHKRRVREGHGRRRQKNLERGRLEAIAVPISASTMPEMT